MTLEDVECSETLAFLDKRSVADNCSEIKSFEENNSGEETFGLESMFAQKEANGITHLRRFPRLT